MGTNLNYTIFKKYILVCALGVLITIHVQSQNIIGQLPEGITHVNIVLLMGQSNMKGRGEVPAIQKAHPRIVL